jgi:hypothetical protein
MGGQCSMEQMYSSLTEEEPIPSSFMLSYEDTTILSICEKNANFLGWCFPITNNIQIRLLQVFQSDFGQLTPIPLILLVLSYTYRSYKWSESQISTFTGYVGEAEGACGYNPYNDTYILKDSYAKDSPFKVYNKLTGSKEDEFPCTNTCTSIDFDLEGNYYISCYYQFYFMKFNKDHKLIWKSDIIPGASEASGIAYRHSDNLLYTCRDRSTEIIVLNPLNGKTVKRLPIIGLTPKGQCHPIKFIQMEIEGNLEELLIIENENGEINDNNNNNDNNNTNPNQTKGAYCYQIFENYIKFHSVFYIPLAGYLNYIYDYKLKKLLVAQCESKRWFEYKLEDRATIANNSNSSNSSNSNSSSSSSTSSVSRSRSSSSVSSVSSSTSSLDDDDNKEYKNINNDNTNNDDDITPRDSNDDSDNNNSNDNNSIALIEFKNHLIEDLRL